MSELVTQLHPEPSFDDFWKAYPRKVGKAQARALFAAITNGGLKTKTRIRDSGALVAIELEATPAELVAAAKRYADSFVDSNYKSDLTYCKHPTTWLNQASWEDFDA